MNIFFFLFWSLVRCPLAMIFNLFGSRFTNFPLTCAVNTCLKWADSGHLEMDWLPDDNLMNFCIYECCNWGRTSLLINYSWWKYGMGDGSVHNEAQWCRYHLIKKVFWQWMQVSAQPNLTQGEKLKMDDEWTQQMFARESWKKKYSTDRKKQNIAVIYKLHLMSINM